MKPEQTFFITFGGEYQQEEQLRDKLLDRAGFHNAAERDDVVIDYFKINKVRSPSGQLWSVGACKRQLAKKLYNVLTEVGFKNVLLKPTPLFLSALSMKLPKKSKGWKVFVQIFLNKTGGLAILVVEKNPVYWKRFSFSQSDSAEKVASAVKSILIQSAVTLARPTVDGFVLQGPDADRISGEL